MVTRPVPTVADLQIRRGILLMLVAMLLFSGADAAAKLLAGRLPASEIVAGRYFFNLLWLVPLGLRFGLRSAYPRLQLARGLFIFGTNILFVASLAHLALGDATAISFISPLALTAMSAIFLGETVGTRRWIAVGAGFLGMLLIVRPTDLGSGEGGWWTLVPLLAALSWAAGWTVTRRMGGIDSPILTLTWTFTIGLCFAAPATALSWVTPSWGELALLIAMAWVTGLAQYWLIRAFALAPASLLAPFTYLQLVAAILLGLVAFGTVPSGTTLAGAVVIVASGLYVARGPRPLAPKPSGPVLDARSERH